MKKRILICCAVVLLIAGAFYAKSSIKINDEPKTPEEIEQDIISDCSRLLDAGIAAADDNMIFVPYKFMENFKIDKIEISPSPPKEGWILFSLTKEGKQMQEIKIPAVFEGKPVVGLSSCAVFNCPDLASVTIPDTICLSFKYVFAYCPKLKSITSSADFFDAVGGVNSPIFAECRISEWNYSGDGLEVEFGFVPWE